MSKPPNITSVKRVIGEMKAIGSERFLAKYANGRGSRSHYLSLDGWHFPVKALWAAAHRPAVGTRSFYTGHAEDGLRSLGFSDFVQLPTPPADPNQNRDQEALEGKRRTAEFERLSRCPKIVRSAKKLYGYTCMACSFNFQEYYGNIGIEFIECHHINPISKRDGKGEITRIEDLVVLCANCHRMAHYRVSEARTITELKALVDNQQKQKNGRSV